MPNEDEFAEPATDITDPGELLAGYLDTYRDALLRKLDGLPPEALRTSILPSGWTPIALVKHLTYVERRWLRWGFAGEDIDRVWGDSDPNNPDGPWFVAETESDDDVIAAFHEEAARCRRLIAAHAVTERGVPGDRFDADKPVPTLGWILLHLIQEYARHVGQLDVVRELTDGSVGE
jgi:uncharacterized damage-inducible protein DinB